MPKNLKSSLQSAIAASKPFVPVKPTDGQVFVEKAHGCSELGVLAFLCRGCHLPPTLETAAASEDLTEANFALLKAASFESLCK